MSERGFELARLRKNDEVVVVEDGKEVLAYPEAQLPEYQTSHSAGADFFCAEEVTIQSIWRTVLGILSDWAFRRIKLEYTTDEECFSNEYRKDTLRRCLAPTLVHTGVKAFMGDDEVLELFNRSSNPLKRGLILANGVGVIDADYYNNKTNDGDIMFAFYNFLPWSVTIKAGERIGQGVFKKFLRPTVGLRIKDDERVSGLGSTDK